MMLAILNLELVCNWVALRGRSPSTWPLLPPYHDMMPKKEQLYNTCLLMLIYHNALVVESATLAANAISDIHTRLLTNAEPRHLCLSLFRAASESAPASL